MNRQKPVFICFTGLDGGGKTTLSKSLISAMNSRGMIFLYSYVRLKPFLSKPFVLIGNFIFLRNEDFFQDYPSYSNVKTMTMRRHTILSKIFTVILIVDYALQIVRRIAVPLKRRKNIVCDRYIFDTVITDISVYLKYSEGQIDTLLKKFFFFFPVPDIIFLVDIPPEVALRRKGDIPSIEYLMERRSLFLETALRYRAVKIDGSKDLDLLKREIVDITIERMRA